MLDGIPLATDFGFKIFPYYVSKKNPAKTTPSEFKTKLIDKSVLQYPHGKNLISIIQQNKQLQLMA